MLNNFFHDLSVGILFANVLLSMFLIRMLEESGSGGGELLARFVRYSSRITWGALLFIIVGGIIRTATYRSFEWVEAAGKGQVAALIVKHIVLVGCTAAGIALQIRIARKYRGRAQGKAADEGKQTA
jgi:hypothetical protein